MAKGKDQGYDTKVPVPAEKPSMGKKPSQPITGKLGDGMSAMPGGGKTTGSPVKTVKSQPITGKLSNGSTAMGSGGVIDGKV